MAVTVANFRIDYPQFASSAEYPDATIERYLERAALRMNADIWGTLYDEGQSLLTAHLLALGAIASLSSGSNTGGITGINIPGQASVQYGQNTTAKGNNSGYSATRYGIEYESLLRLIPNGIARIF